MLNYKSITLVVVLLWGQNTFSQQRLGADEVVQLTLEHNPEVRRARNQYQIAQKNAELGASDFLPTVSLSGSYNYTQNNRSLTEFASPQMDNIEESGAVNQSYNAGLDVNYNIYSGGRKKYSLQVAESGAYSEKMNRDNLSSQTVLNALLQYLNAVSFYNQFQINREILLLSRNRYDRAEENFQYGNFNKLQVLNAEVDLRTDSATFIRSEVDYQNAMVELNLAMGIPADSTYAVDTIIELKENLSYSMLEENLLNRNPQYQAAKTQVEQAEMQIKINQSNLIPSLDFSGGYSFSRTEYEANFLSLTQNLGWNAGLTLSYTLYNGGNTRRNITIAELQKSSSEENLRQIRQQLITNLKTLYQNYQNSLRLVQFFQRDLETAQLNFERSDIAYGKGQITGIELREAQLRLSRALNNLQSQRIQAQRDEFNLLNTSGILLNDFD